MTLPLAKLLTTAGVKRARNWIPASAGISIHYMKLLRRQESSLAHRIAIKHNISMRCTAVYIMASARNGTLYIGATTDLVRRVYDHRSGHGDGFPDRYGCKILVWFEQCDGIEGAFTRERQIKAWKRNWKLRLIEENNPDWRDLWDDIT